MQFSGQTAKRCTIIGVLRSFGTGRSVVQARRSAVFSVREVVTAVIVATVATLLWRYVAGPFLRGFVRGLRRPSDESSRSR